MAALAQADGAEFERLWDEAGLPREAEAVRGPETGLVMLRGRVGGGGAPFNFGEATVTRATVRLPGGAVGHAYALGRDKEKARLAAIADALWQDPAQRADVEAKVLQPLRAAAAAADAKRRAETAATKVDFFTLVRGRGLMLALTETIDGGFADPVFDAQAVFRAVMDAMARPGTMSAVQAARRAAAAAVADGRRGRADAVRPRHAGLARSGAASIGAVRSWLAFHTGAPVADTPSDAAFALVAEPGRADRAREFRAGHAGISRSLDHADPAGRQPVVRQRAVAAGPGHRDHRRRSRRGRCRAISPSSGSRTMRASRAASTSILAAPDGVACLPRTTRIRMMEA